MLQNSDTRRYKKYNATLRYALLWTSYVCESCDLCSIILSPLIITRPQPLALQPREGDIHHRGVYIVLYQIEKRQILRETFAHI